MAHKWYIIHTMSGSENKVKQMIFERAEKKGMLQLIEDVVVPAVEVPEIKKGKKVKTEKKFMPGYVLVKMDMTDEAWHLVKEIPRVTGFLGSGSKPRPVPESEVQVVFGHIESNAKGVVLSELYEIGEQITVTDGPFESFAGIVEDVDYEKSKITVSVSIFGRATPIDLNFTQVKK